MKFRVALIVCFLSGFHALSYEVLWFRYYSYAARSSPSAFGILLGSYLLGIAFGSVSARLVLELASDRDAGRARRVLILASLAAASLAFLVLPMLAVLRVASAWVAAHLVVVLAAAAMGILMPLLCQLSIAANGQAGSRVSYLYVGNIVGSATGSLLTGLCLFEYLGPSGISRFLYTTGVATTLLLLVTFATSRCFTWRLGSVAVGCWALGLSLTSLLFEDFHEKLLFGGPYPKLERVIENRHGIIAIGSDSTVYGGGAYDGRIAIRLPFDTNGILRAYAVSALHANPRRVLVIGLSGGAWTRVISQLPGVEVVDAVEINPGYLELIRGFPLVAPLLDDPKVHVFIDDGRRWLNRHPSEKYDVIVQNTTFHWRAHATNVLSREYLELCRQHLRPEGLIAINTTNSDAVYRTVLASFSSAIRVLNLVVAGEQPVSFSRERWRELLSSAVVNGTPILQGASPQVRQALLAVSESWGTPAEHAVLESRESILARVGSAPVITDDNMASEWSVPHFGWSPHPF